MDIGEWMENAGEQLLDAGVETFVREDGRVFTDLSEIIDALGFTLANLVEYVKAGAFDPERCEGVWTVYVMLKSIHDAAVVRNESIPDTLDGLADGGVDDQA